jgi:hypothetical protein
MSQKRSARGLVTPPAAPTPDLSAPRALSNHAAITNAPTTIAPAITYERRPNVGINSIADEAAPARWLDTPLAVEGLVGSSRALVTKERILQHRSGTFVSL